MFFPGGFASGIKIIHKLKFSTFSFRNDILVWGGIIPFVVLNSRFLVWVFNSIWDQKKMGMKMWRLQDDFQDLFGWFGVENLDF